MREKRERAALQSPAIYHLNFFPQILTGEHDRLPSLLAWWRSVGRAIAGKRVARHNPSVSVHIYVAYGFDPIHD